MAGVLQKLTDAENVYLGMAAGVVTKSINYPLLVWKNSCQQGLPLIFNPKQIYRGLPVACMNLGSATALQFALTGFFQKLFTAGEDRKLTTNEELSAAFIGGLISGVPCSLYELTMIQQQRFGGSLLGTPIRLVSEFGFTSLFRGIVTTMGRESVYTMGMLGVCPVVSHILEDKFNQNKNISLGAGALIGAATSATLTHPMDTIKTCMQGDVAQIKYGSIRETSSHLVTEYGGISGLFRGLNWRVGMITTSFFLINHTKITLAPIMFPKYFKHP